MSVLPAEIAGLLVAFRYMPVLVSFENENDGAAIVARYTASN